MRNSRNVWNHNIQTRSIYKNIFSQTKPQEIEQTQNMERLVQINDWRNTFYSSDMRANLTLKNCINTISKYAAMLHPIHISNDKTTGGKTPTQSNLQQLLELRPNLYMSSYDFLYKTCVQLLTNKNAYISIQRDENGNIISLWPLEYSYCETKEINGNVFLQYTFQNSVAGEQRKTISYEDIIHLRYDFSNGELS